MTMSATNSDNMQELGRWLMSISAQEMQWLQPTNEYRDFMRSIHNLQVAHKNLRRGWHHHHSEQQQQQQQQVPTLIQDSHLLTGSRSSDGQITTTSEEEFGDDYVHGRTNGPNPRPIGSGGGSSNEILQQHPDRVPMSSTASSSSLSFLQHLCADDILRKILDFLESLSLAAVTQSCARFRMLALDVAQRKTHHIALERQLPNVLQLLRAQEQIDGIELQQVRDEQQQQRGGSNTSVGRRWIPSSVVVRIPTLLLRRRVLVTNSGDPEYNGIYYCTGSNGNGFLFTKPRTMPGQRRIRRRRTEQERHRGVFHGSAALPLPHHQQHSITPSSTNSSPTQHSLPGETTVTPRRTTEHAGRYESEVADPGQLLRCIIAKRFSNETILWYFSKEVITADERNNYGGNNTMDIDDTSVVVVSEESVTQIFSFWAKLMVIGDATPDVCRYPSQTSILTRHNRNDGWQSLVTTRNIQPPTVELLD